MKTELKMVAQFYIGCDLKTKSGTIKLVGVHIDEFNEVEKAVVLNGNVTHTIDFDNIKLILRPLSDMTDKENKVYNSLDEMRPNFGYQSHWIERELWEINMWVRKINYLRSIGIDCDNLIENNLAINKAEL